MTWREPRAGALRQPARGAASSTLRLGLGLTNERGSLPSAPLGLIVIVVSVGGSPLLWCFARGLRLIGAIYCQMSAGSVAP